MTATEKSGTCGQILPDGRVLEILSGERLLLWQRGRSVISSKFQVGSNCYFPKQLGKYKPTLPTSVAEPPLPAKLISQLAKLLSSCGLQNRDARLGSFFILGTWFADFLPWIPSLVLHGPLYEALQLLQVLTAVCRRGVHVCKPSISLLKKVPDNLWPAIIISQRELKRDLQQYLVAAAQKSFTGEALPRVPSISKVIYCDGIELDPWLQTISLAMHVPRTGLANIDAGKLARHFQPLLLGYRLEHVNAVARSHFDASDFCTPVIAPGTCRRHLNCFHRTRYRLAQWRLIS